MTLNISDYLHEGMSRGWTVGDAMDVARRIASKVPGSILDADLISGERWIRVILNREVIAMVSVNFGIGFVDGSVCGSGWVGLIELSSMDDPYLVMDKRLLEMLAGRSLGDDQDQISISANDLFAITAT